MARRAPTPTHSHPGVLSAPQPSEQTSQNTMLCMAHWQGQSFQTEDPFLGDLDTSR